MEKLIFATAGIPLCTKPRSYKNAFEDLISMNLGGLEIEFVHGVKMSEANVNEVIEFAGVNNIVLTAHAPFYVNLNSKEPEKTLASIERIIETARMAKKLEIYSIVFHAAYNMEMSQENVYKKVRAGFDKIMEVVYKEDIKTFVRPETTGKPTQWGDLSEVIKISKEFEQVLPCIDFSHLYARTVGGYNTYDDFCRILETIGNELGDFALQNFHAHIAGIEFSAKGEKKHLNLDEASFNYKDLLKALKHFSIKGVVVCESPNIEEDAMLLSRYYNSL